MKQHRFSGETAVKILLGICGAVSIACVALITGYLLWAGTPAIAQIGWKEFFFGTVWRSNATPPEYGILPFVLTSICGTLGAILLGVPLGVLSAVCLAKLVPEKLRQLLHPAVELLAGIPSVVYGLTGMMVLVPGVRKLFGLPDGANLFSAILILAVMILPPIIQVSENALRAVPEEYEQASLALGASRVEPVFHVTLPAASDGIAAAVVLGIGRAVGEAMAVMMVAGNVANMPGLFKSVRFLTTAVASEMAYASGLSRQALFSIALVLFFFVMIINLTLDLIMKRRGNR